MPKVYVTNYNPEYSYKHLEEHGELVFMTQGLVPPSKFKNVEERFRKFAKEATEDDTLLLSGANILAAMAVSAWLGEHDSVTLLQYTRKRDENGRVVPTYMHYILEA